MSSFLSNVNTQIDPADEMFLYAMDGLKNRALARSVYFRQGAEINNTVQQLLNWRFSLGKEDVKFLDFACGYGRSTRFLITAIPPKNVWVSDIYGDAVSFQKRYFGVNGFNSFHDPRDLSCDLKFDMIFVASLFTHMPAERFREWLNKLFELLEPRGILAFSVHDETLAAGQRIPDPGILFVRQSESKTLSKNEYGSSYVTEAFVRSTIEAAGRSGWRYKRLIRALCGEQDVYVISRDGEETFAGFAYRQPPVGYVDWFKISPQGELRIGGWAGEPNDGVELDAVQVRIDGRLVMSRKPDMPREDVVKVLGNNNFAFSGWECLHAMGQQPEQNLEVLVEVTAVSQSGLSTMLHVSPLSAGREVKSDTALKNPSHF